MPKPTISRAQLEALAAIARGEIFGTGNIANRLWWRQMRAEATPHAITRTVWILIGHGVAASGDPDDDDRTPVELTAAGRELLDDLASREPHPDQEGSTR